MNVQLFCTSCLSPLGIPEYNHYTAASKSYSKQTTCDNHMIFLFHFEKKFSPRRTCYCLEVSQIASLQICNWNLEIPTVRKRSIVEFRFTFWTIFLNWFSWRAKKDGIQENTPSLQEDGLENAKWWSKSNLALLPDCNTSPFFEGF